ncbi:MAG: polyprenyl synthetase [Actinomycetales bacterium]|nr:MAG: polyprenyl synthetase [Actinomycetales bacterium]
MTHPLDRDDLRPRVQAGVLAELARQRLVLQEIGPELDPLVDVIERLLSGGKRLRATFTYWGYRSAGRDDSDAIVRLATAMEFFQAAALVHDDVMDNSDTRRGMPSAHRALASWHRERGWEGNAERFGAGAAILAGDLCLQWADEIYSTSGLPVDELARARAVFDQMRTQLMGGQFLDLLESVRSWPELSHRERLAASRRVIRYKSAKYTIEAPLLVGALAGGAPEAALTLLSAYGLALGEAFQLRDDLLGVFGDPVLTGKPAGDDLREGKRTVLVAHALETADDNQRTVLTGLFGRPDLDQAGVGTLRRILQDTGAVAQVETEIERLADQARRAIAEAGPLLADPACDVLEDLVDVVTARDT